MFFSLESAICAADDFLYASFSKATPHPVPKDIPPPNLSVTEQVHVAGLMRINHVGEVCAQALYSGAKLFAEHQQTYEFLDRAQKEEIFHFSWCNERLQQLNASPSLFTPVYYGCSFLMGAAAGLSGDKVSLGFVVETEKQVEEHLNNHLHLVPKHDGLTISILEKMKEDETEHAANAERLGGTPPPAALKETMSFLAGVMKKVSYYL